MQRTRYSSVLWMNIGTTDKRSEYILTHLPMSKIDLTPAETKPTEQRESSCKSAEISIAVANPHVSRYRGKSGTTRTILSPAVYSAEAMNT